jgi:hypothetical protein
MSNFLTRLIDRTVVPQPDMPLVRPLGGLYEGGGFDAELETQEVETRAGVKRAEPVARAPNAQRRQPIDEVARPNEPQPQPLMQHHISREVRTVEEMSQPRRESYAADVSIGPKAPERESVPRDEPRSKWIVRDEGVRPPSPQPLTLPSVIDHIFRDESEPSTPHEPQAEARQVVEKPQPDTAAEAPAPPLVSIGRIDISVAPPLLMPSRESGPPRSQGFAAYSRVRRGQER